MATSKTAKVSSLRARAIAESAKHAHRHENWVDHLRKTHPEECAELLELVEAWRAGDKELRAAYPSGHHLARFLSELDFITVRESSIRKLIGGRL